MSKERKPTPRKKPATPKGEFWDVVRVGSGGRALPQSLTDDDDHLSKDEARFEALGAFLHGTTERVYIESYTTHEKIDCTAEMRKVEEEFERRRDARTPPGKIDIGPPRPGEIKEIIRAVLPEVTPPEFDEGA
jgi:hypothetical protein